MQKLATLLFCVLFSFSGLSQSKGDFRTISSGDWNNVAIWEEWVNKQGGRWDPAGSFPTDKDNTITISSGHIVNFPSGFSQTIDQVEIEEDATLFISAGSTMSVLDDNSGYDILLIAPISGGSFGNIVVGGQLILSDGATLGEGVADISATNFIIENTGEFHHNYDGNSGGRIADATWSAGSTLRITLKGGVPTNLGQSFQNVIFENPTQNGALDLAGTLTEVNGSLSVLNTNSRELQFSNAANYTLTVGNDISISGTSQVSFANAADVQLSVGGSFTTSSTTQLSDLSGTFTIGGNLNVTGGQLTLSQNGSVSVNVGSTVLFASATTIESGLVTPSSIIMTGSGQIASQATINGLIDWNVASSAITDLSTNLTVNDFSVESGGSLSLYSNTLSITGDLSSGGTVNGGNSTIFMNGSGSQTISGSIAVHNLTIGATSISSNEGVADLHGTLLLQTGGQLDMDGAAGSGVFTVKSTAVDQNARIDILPDPTALSGIVTVERFIDGPGDWRYISSPVTDGNLGMWSDDIPVTGDFSDAAPVGIDNVVRSDALSAFEYDAANILWSALSAAGGPTSSVPLENGRGYSVFTYKTEDAVLSVSGSPAKGDVVVPLVANQWNLVGNPYPSAITWNNIGLTGINTTVSIRTANEVFASYNQGAGTGAGHPDTNWAGEIAMGQSFWIFSNTAGSITFTENAKSGNNNQFLRTSDSKEYVKIKATNGVQTDEAVIYFRDYGTRAWDEDWDGIKFKNGGWDRGLGQYDHINLSTTTSETDESLSFNALPDSFCEIKTVIELKDTKPGTYTVEFDLTEDLNPYYDFILFDRLTGEEVEISDSSKVTVNIGSNDAISPAERLELTIYRNDLAALTEYESTVTCESVSLGTPKGYNQNHTLIKNGSSQEYLQVNGQFTIPYNDLKEGINQFDLVIFFGECRSEVVESYFEFEYQPLKLEIHSDADKICFNESFHFEVISDSEFSEYQIYHKDNLVDPILVSDTKSISLEGQSGQNAYYVGAVTSGGCTSEFHEINFEVIDPEQPEITISNDTLLSSVEKNIQWFQDGLLIATNTPYLPAGYGGAYQVVHEIGGCKSASELYLITTLGEELSDEHLRIYPNPAQDFIQVNGLAQETLYQLLTASGQQISYGSLQSGSSIAIANLAKGLYILMLDDGDSSQQLRFYKE